MAHAPWKTPPEDLVAIVDAAPTPLLGLAPDGRTALLADYAALPPLAVVAEPWIGLAGMRLHRTRHEPRRLHPFTRFRLREVGGAGDWRELEGLAPAARLGRPHWAPDSRSFAFTVTTDLGVELWLADVASRAARRLLGPRLNDVFANAVAWWSGSAALLVRLVPPGQGPPPAPPQVPLGPVVEDARGLEAQNRTHQDLLQTAHDEALFEHRCTAVLGRVDLARAEGEVEPVSEPAIWLDAAPSPDGRFLLLERARPPWSHQVPIHRFGRTIEIADRRGRTLHTIAELPPQEAIPIQGVPQGPRSVTWQPELPAALLWVEAQDGGDPRAAASVRDRLFELEAPFSSVPRPLKDLAHRFVGADALAGGRRLFVSEWDRDRNWVTTHLADLATGTSSVLFDRSVNDRYGDPGEPMHRRTDSGFTVVRAEGDAIYLAGAGATPAGDRPFLDRFDLGTRETQRLYHSNEDALAPIVQFAGGRGTAAVIVRRETRTQPPNFVLVDLERGGAEMALTEFRDPHPQLTGIHKEVLHYARPDGVELSGTLYLPPDYVEGTRLPLVVWAYPHEFTDRATASQVDAQPNRFTRLAGTSPLFFLTRGYAVLEDARMAVVGEPATANDTFVEQIVASAAAAIDACVARGVADPARAGVGGHSYGAFMTVALLAHSRLFKAGIARSGAYNRTLTPFGFQNERRTLWEAKDVYLRLSPFLDAEKVKDPLLLIHGEVDDNSGTHPLQSQRLFHALAGLKATARLVVLPHEAHGYSARESVLHVLAESLEWFDRYVKG